MILFLLLLLPVADAPKPAKLSRDQLIQGARTVVAAVVRAGKENARRAKPVKGDQLTSFYVQAALRSVASLPENQRMPSLMLGLGVALDDAKLMRFNPVVGLTWRAVETNAERSARLAVLGAPSLHGRRDLAQHFFVSTALTAVLGAKAAEAAGIAKEILDAQDGGSGFSFADLAADFSGVHLASWLIDKPARAKFLQKGFTASDFVVGPKGLDEGLSMARFEKRYGGVRGEKFTKQCDALRRRIKALPGYQRDKGAVRESSSH